MNKKDSLIREIEICKLHASRLKFSIEKTKHLQPFTAELLSRVDGPDLGYLELLTNRLAKLQAHLGEKVFTLLLDCIGEDVSNKSHLDKIHKLEKLEILEDKKWWLDLRNLRNFLTHEYPDNPEFIATNLNDAVIESEKLVKFLEKIEKYINEKLN